MTTPWRGRVHDALKSRYGFEEANSFIHRYGDAFEDRYMRSTSTEQTIRDLEQLDALDKDVHVAVDLQVPQAARHVEQHARRGVEREAAPRAQRSPFAREEHRQRLPGRHVPAECRPRGA